MFIDSTHAVFGGGLDGHGAGSPCSRVLLTLAGTACYIERW